VALLLNCVAEMYTDPLNGLAGLLSASIHGLSARPLLNVGVTAMVSGPQVCPLSGVLCT
jgi:hypothetical protein